MNKRFGTILKGAGLGVLVGAISAYLYDRAAEDNGGRAVKPASMSALDMIKVGTAVVGLVRLVAEVGSSKGKDEQS